MAPPRLNGMLSSNLFLKGAGGAAFLLFDTQTWRPIHMVAWVAFILLGLELLSTLVFVFGYLVNARAIAARGKHLDELEWLDLAFISFNKLCTPLFTYHLLRVVASSAVPEQVVWSLQGFSVQNTVVAFVALFVVYDFFYTLFHRALHHRSVYKYIHKHHHRQKVPTRGNLDAVNVHPFEFVCGEYNHMLAIVLVSRFIVPVHCVTILTFIVVGGFLASLNHTRYDIRFPIINSIYQVRYHDIHHWFPDSNYGQYIMLWDHIFASYKAYPEAIKTQ